jgi:hypothetical protein
MEIIRQIHNTHIFGNIFHFQNFVNEIKIENSTDQIGWAENVDSAYVIFE